MNRNWMYMKQLPEDDGIISVGITRHPRWKESELSGDEWRYTLIGRVRYRDWQRKRVSRLTVGGFTIPDIAARIAGWMAKNHHKYEFPSSVSAFEDITFCFQPGCTNSPESVYQIKQEWTTFPHQGYRMDRDHPVIRAFCGKHSHRGDCDLEDADKNYELIAGPFVPREIGEEDDDDES